MKEKLFKQLVRKMVSKTIIFVFLLIIVASIAQSVSPIVDNNMSLGQMQNSDEMFVIMEAYNKIKAVFNIIYIVITGFFASTVVRDIREFNKTINETTEKEN